MHAVYKCTKVPLMSFTIEEMKPYPGIIIPIQITILFAVVVIVCLYYGKVKKKTIKENNHCTVHKDMRNFCHYTEAY